MNRNKKQHTPDATEQVAKLIALKIITWQSSLSGILNVRINRLSRLRQTWLLFAFCAVSIFGFAFCLVFPNDTVAIKTSADSYQPTHIGLPSGRPKPDSLTIKK